MNQIWIINYLFLLLSLIPFTMKAQEWRVEAEDPGCVVKWNKGLVDIVSPKGMTLWCCEEMKGNVVIEYEARIVADKRFRDDKGNVRVSDLNCFWMADKCGGYGAKFVDNYALQMYYVGYGGNWNTTTRFRRYDGDARGVDSAEYRPKILKEYTDTDHLLKPNRWYKTRLEQVDGKVRYSIDGELLIDYLDTHPLTKGYFGFRTTMAHAQLRHFRFTCSDPNEKPILVRRINGIRNSQPSVTTFGVPFSKGEKADDAFTITDAEGNSLPFSTWRLASWPDGSAKWQAFCASVPVGCDSLFVVKGGPSVNDAMSIPQPLPFYVTVNGRKQEVEREEMESVDNMRIVRKYCGKNFIVRTYQYSCTKEIKLIHTLLVDSVLNRDGLNELSVHFKVPMHGKPYERYVQFDKRPPMSVQPLVARRSIDLAKNDSVTQSMIMNIAQWDGFRLSQLSYNGYSIRKRSTSVSPWIGTEEGTLQSDGRVTVGDSVSSTSFRLKDFAESYPSTLQVDNARSDTSIVSICLYSSEAETYSFEHYDTIAHTLEAAYEDVQPGMSTAWGIGRTSTIFINEADGSGDNQYVCTPEHLYRTRAFGIWSLPVVESERDSVVESTISSVMDFYKDEIKKHSWYGFFNYGDVMHTYDVSRSEWRYDVGGFAWDNTELGTPAMLWYQFLRTGDADVWKMAESMTRHCSEVDTYHFGPHAGLGSRHNVTHWGCGAKEARISEAWWNRFYYYLTADERVGDIMHEVADADTLLYTLDPMRLAQPREKYLCSAPARLRIGPDWMAYASNWFTEWERGNDRYLKKLTNGMNSIANLPHGFYQGPLALGYDPATGIISTDMPDMLSSNHLMPIMGGFELLNEMEMSISHKPFYDAWLFHNQDYKENALKIRGNKFRIPRLSAYAGWRLGDERLKEQAWKELLNNKPLSTNKSSIYTNDCATWTIDAIFIKETINK